MIQAPRLYCLRSLRCTIMLTNGTRSNMGNDKSIDLISLCYFIRCENSVSSFIFIVVAI